MKKKPFNPLLLGAVVLGLIAFYIVYSQFQSMEAQRRTDMAAQEARLRKEFESSKPGQVLVVDKEKKRAVVYAKVQIKSGDKIEAPMLETKDTPETLLLAAYTRPDEVVGQYAVTNIEIGEPLMPNNVSKLVQRMSVKLTPGMRAVSLSIEGARNVTGGFVTDGDLVDILLTYKLTAKQEGKEQLSRTVIVLQNVKVLYAPGPDDYRTDQTRSLKVRPAGEMVTFEVTPDQAEMLVQMSDMGVYRLILRNRDDKVQWRTKGFSSTEFFDDDASAQRRANRSLQTAAEIGNELKQSSEQAGGGNSNAK
ncbi:MAG: Flp pilus assembly protein CpaB [Verrucomicrobia bacterium Tous-C9LFEB]|nr:MAG: Flp pilus assembly protein CpaB [Verrucomicrobia bacterium Tous-C9LFEB]